MTKRVSPCKLVNSDVITTNQYLSIPKFFSLVCLCTFLPLFLKEIAILKSNNAHHLFSLYSLFFRLSVSYSFHTVYTCAAYMFMFTCVHVLFNDLTVHNGTSNLYMCMYGTCACTVQCTCEHATVYVL